MHTLTVVFCSSVKILTVPSDQIEFDSKIKQILRNYIGKLTVVWFSFEFGYRHIRIRLCTGVGFGDCANSVQPFSLSSWTISDVFLRPKFSVWRDLFFKIRLKKDSPMIASNFKNGIIPTIDYTYAWFQVSICDCIFLPYAISLVLISLFDSLVNLQRASLPSLSASKISRIHLKWIIPCLPMQ